LVAGASLFIYLPIMHQGSEFLSFWGSPFFEATTLWIGLGNALATRSSGNPDGANGPQIWIWIGLLLAGIIVGVIVQRTRVRQTPKPEVASKSANPERSDLALFCVTSVVLGIIGYFGFLLKLHLFVQPWFYVEILILCAISLDGILSVSSPALRPLGIGARWLPSGDDDIKRRASVGGSAHPSEQFRRGCRFSQPQRFSGRPYRGPGNMGGYHV